LWGGTEGGMHYRVGHDKGDLVSDF
jgi:hypothetical protein